MISVDDLMQVIYEGSITIQDIQLLKVQVSMFNGKQDMKAIEDQCVAYFNNENNNFIELKNKYEKELKRFLYNNYLVSYEFKRHFGEISFKYPYA